MEEILQDSRFAHVVKDPRFRRIPKHERKVKIDKRFQSMFRDKNFKVKYTIDKRGRPAKTSTTEDLKRYYDISSSDESGTENDEPKKAAENSKQNKKRKIDGVKQCVSVNEVTKRESSSSDIQEDEQEEHDETSSSDEYGDLSDNVLLSDKVKGKLHDMTVDYARGEGVLLSDSSSDDDSDSGDVSEDSEELEHNWGELDKDAGTTQEATRRIAICNMDWDRVHAQDLLVLLSSFLPKIGGAIERVTIYPSEFGLQRMKEEEVKGPLELCDNKIDFKEVEDEVDEEETEEGRRYHMEKLRRYQLNRLRYYYAIAECDSVSTAESIYNECDGLEYESSATKLDLRFVPDEMTFDQEPRETCDTLPQPGKYAPKLFTTTALQQAKVDLTWDETDPQRVDVARKLQTVKSIDEIDDADLRAYLASSGSESEEQEDELNIEKKESSSEVEEQSTNGDALSRYKLLLEEAERQEQAKKKKSEDIQMEVTWGLGLKEKTEKMVKERLKSENSEITPFEQMLAKKREKRKQRKEERKKLKQQQNNVEENGDGAPFSDDDIPSDIDMSDPYFKEEMKDIQPKADKKKNRKHTDTEIEENSEDMQKKAELELLMLEDGGEDNKKHFSLKSIQEEESKNLKKKKKKLGKKAKKEEQNGNAEDDFQVNLNDERFAALFSSHHYNIDPTDPHYKRTKGMEALRTAKLERRQKEEKDVQPTQQDNISNLRDTSLSQLVKSVKMKTRRLVK